MRLLRMSILMVFLGVPSFAVALDVFNTEADKAYNRGDFKTAYEIWQPMAEKGDAVAQLKIAVRYYEGNGVRKDYVEAFRWYKLSAEQGNTSAQVNVASMLHTGIGTTQNYIEAYKWAKLAASTGDVTGISLKESLDKELTPQQIAAGKKLAKEWMDKHQR